MKKHWIPKMLACATALSMVGSVMPVNSWGGVQLSKVAEAATTLTTDTSARVESGAWWTNFSDYYTLSGNFHVAFNLTTDDTPLVDNWNAPVFIFTTNAERGSGEAYKEYLVMRSDDYGWGTEYDSTTFSGWKKEDGTSVDWDTYKVMMQGASLVADIARNNDQFKVIYTMTAKDGTKATNEINFTVTDAPETMNIFLASDTNGFTINSFTNYKDFVASNLPEGITFENDTFTIPSNITDCVTVAGSQYTVDLSKLFVSTTTLSPSSATVDAGTQQTVQVTANGITREFKYQVIKYNPCASLRITSGDNSKVIRGNSYDLIVEAIGTDSTNTITQDIVVTSSDAKVELSSSNGNQYIYRVTPAEGTASTGTVSFTCGDQKADSTFHVRDRETVEKSRVSTDDIVDGKGYNLAHRSDIYKLSGDFNVTFHLTNKAKDSSDQNYQHAPSVIFSTDDTVADGSLIQVSRGDNYNNIADRGETAIMIWDIPEGADGWEVWRNMMKSGADIVLEISRSDNMITMIYTSVGTEDASAKFAFQYKNIPIEKPDVYISFTGEGNVFSVDSFTNLSDYTVSILPEGVTINDNVYCIPVMADCVKENGDQYDLDLSKIFSNMEEPSVTVEGEQEYTVDVTINGNTQKFTYKIVVGTVKLQALVDADAEVKEENYTASSYAEYKSALDAAKAVLSKENPEWNEIKEATQALKLAKDNLKILSLYTITLADSDILAALTLEASIDGEEVEIADGKFTASQDSKVVIKATVAEGYDLSTLKYKIGDGAEQAYDSATGIILDSLSANTAITFTGLEKNRYALTYAIDADSAESGSLAVTAGGKEINTGDKVEFGTEVSVKVTPADHQEVSGFSVTCNGTAVETTQTPNEDRSTTYTFNMPTGDTAVKVSFSDEQQHSITVAESTKATITANKEDGYWQDVVTVTVEPKETDNPYYNDYQLGITVKSKDQSAVSVTQVKGDSVPDGTLQYTFVLPSQDVTISENFVYLNLDDTKRPDVDNGVKIDYIKEVLGTENSQVIYTENPEALDWNALTKDGISVSEKTGKTIYVRTQGSLTGGVATPASRVEEVVVPARPEVAAELESIGKTEAVMKPVAEEYKATAKYACAEAGSEVSEDAWQASNVFTGLKEETAYKFYVKIEASDTYFKSETASTEGTTVLAVPTVSNVTAAGIYGQTLAEMKIQGSAVYNDQDVAGTFAWEHADAAAIKPNAGKISEYTAVFTPDDKTYGAVTKIPVALEVAKAVPEYKLPEGLTAVEGTTLGAISLPAGFAFEQAAETLVGNAGENSFKVTYTPEDLDNYEIVTGLTVTITVTAKPVDPDQPTDPDTPTEPDKPTDPDTPTEPDKPTDPDTPTDPDKPTDPDTPTDPDKPTNPDTPSTPSGGNNSGGSNLIISGVTGGGSTSNNTNSDQNNNDNNTTNPDADNNSSSDNTTKVETGEDGTVVETKTETAANGTVTETVKETAVDGSVKETVTEKTTDGTVKETIKETAGDVTKEVVKETAANGAVTTQATVTDQKSAATLTATVKKDNNGNVTEANAVISAGASTSNVSGNKASVAVNISDTILETAKQEGIDSVVVELSSDVLTDAMEKGNVTKGITVNVNVGQTEDIGVSGVVLTKDSVAEAKSAGQKVTINVSSKDKQYQVVIPAKQLAKLDGSRQMDITIDTTAAQKLSDKQGKTQVSKAVDKALSNSNAAKKKTFVLSVAENGDVTAGLKVTAEIDSDTDISANQNVYVYKYNKKTGKLVEVANSKQKVSAKGTVQIDAQSGNDYIVSSKKLTGGNVRTLKSQISANASKNSVKAGKSITIDVSLPSALKQVKNFDAGTSFGKEKAVVLYKSSDSKVASVNASGVVKAKKAGKATITITVGMESGQTKTMKKTVTVK